MNAETFTTARVLAERYGARDIPLAEVAARFFGLSAEQASKAASRGRLPVPTFRARPSQKSPLLVRVDDLAQLLDERYALARNAWPQLAEARP